MSQSPKKDSGSCHQSCQSAYDACMQSKEHESVCRMKKQPVHLRV
jgi:hypothetical protein